METRANYVLVGFMTFAALIAAFVLVWWIGNYSTNQDSRPVDIVIRGSVSGLGVGSQVQFNGVPVGRVTGLRLDQKNPEQVIIQTAINPETPLREDTKASIGVRGLSGGAFIQLSGGSAGKSPLFSTSQDGTQDETKGQPRLIGDPSNITELIDRVNGVATQTERIMGTLQKLVEENSTSISSTISNTEQFSKALASNTGGVERFLASADTLAVTVEKVSGTLEATLIRAEKLIAAVDPDKIGKTVNDLASTAEGARKVVEGIDPQTIQNSVDDIGKAANRLTALLAGVEDKALSDALAKFTSLADRADKIVAAVEPATISQTVDDLSQTAKAARGMIEGVDAGSLNQLIADLSDASSKASAVMASLDANKVNTALDKFAEAAEGAQTIVQDVSKVTSKLGNRAGDIDQIVTDAGELAERLNKSSQKLDNVLNGLNGFLGSGDANGVMADVRNTLAEFRRTARNLNAQIAGVASGINRFTGRGLSDTQGLIKDARQSIKRLDRVIRNLQDNPSSLITGGGGSRIRERGAGRPRR